jgi:Mannosylglycerate hydrolase MGH1-like glycoside hydrolase domain
VVYPDGSLVRGPKALCELQGYVYDAWLRMSEVFAELDKHSRAEQFRTKAAALFDHFNEAFWDEELGCYAFALDGEKKKVLTVASNAGHCLWSGIVPPERAGKVVRRLMAPDMWSGWGIRTLSALHPAFNPYNYQTGSVWPHDNAIIALWLRRRGGEDRSRYQRRGEPLLVQPAARALHDDRARCGELPGPIPWSKHTAGLGGGFGLRADAGDAGVRPERAARKAACRPVAAGMAARPDRVRPSRRRTPI